MLKIQNADKYFNRHRRNQIHVINHTSIDTSDAGLIALLGPSGCGKTTLLNVIGGLDKLRRGSIYVNHKKISSRWMYKVDKIRNLEIGYIFQDYKLIDNLSVFDNVSIVLKMQGVKSATEIREKVEYVLDCVGMLRYKKRPAGMLSGGERQRVGIARALVKNPNVILADEPTGNLDSKNSLEIMQIIKAISEKKIVILVTHEQELAKFYANRIIEIEDGCIKKDYLNDLQEDLDYGIDGNFYLKDFKENIELKDNKVNIHLYRDTSDKVSLDIVVKNGNIYIKSNTVEKVSVVDEDSGIEFINNSYEKLSHEKRDKYQFDFDKIKDVHKKRYASIISPIKMIYEGFQKVFQYTFLKKILLVGFFLAGMFIMYSVSSYMASLKINEKDYVRLHSDYLTIKSNSLNLDDYLKQEKNEDILYMIPGSSKVEVNVPLKDYFQTSKMSPSMDVSIVSSELLKDSFLLEGRLPLQNNEVILDELAFDIATEEDPSYQMGGIIAVRDMLDRSIMIRDREYKVVGIVSLGSPCLYMNQSELFKVIGASTMDMNKVRDDNTTVTLSNVFSYEEYQSQVEIKKGRTPNNDYEVIVPISNEEVMPLNKEINQKINGKKLVVVGYYTSVEQINLMLCNTTTRKYLIILKNQSITIMPKKDKKEVLLNVYQENGYDIHDTYQESRDKYLKSKKSDRKTTFVVSGIMLSISFIEIFLMIRSSFLSRVKMVGIYRAIGVKVRDICKMFMGEIFAITTLASIPGVLFMAYILKILTGIKYLRSFILIDSRVVITSIVMIYVFNLIIGLLPVINTIRKRPAVILSRYDLD